MVGTGILYKCEVPSPECYTTFWMMTIYSDTLHWSGITPILIWTLLPKLTFYLIKRSFHRIFATEDTYSSGHLVMSHFGICKCTNVERKRKAIWLSPMTKTPIPTEHSQNQWTTQKRHQKLKYTTIADRLRKVSWSNNSHPTGVVKPVYEYPSLTPISPELVMFLTFDFRTSLGTSVLLATHHWKFSLQSTSFIPLTFWCVHSWMDRCFVQVQFCNVCCGIRSVWPILFLWCKRTTQNAKTSFAMNWSELWKLPTILHNFTRSAAIR